MALPININNLVTNNVIESERIEFKQGWNPQVILHTFCGFANDFNNIGGGDITVGVAEDNGLAIMPPKVLADKSHKPYYIRRMSSTTQASNEDL